MSTSSVGRPGKYQRSAGGLVAALVITVVIVGALLWFLGLFRTDTDIDPEEIDYLGVAGEAQDAGLEPVYPTALPEGWIATGYDVTAVDGQALEIRMLTDDDNFVGIHQEDASVSALVREYVDEETSSIDIYTTDGSVAEAWEGYEDEDGDTAYATQVGDQTVLVYGSASPEELQDLIDRLTTKPVAKD